MDTPRFPLHPVLVRRRGGASLVAGDEDHGCDQYGPTVTGGELSVRDGVQHVGESAVAAQPSKGRSRMEASGGVAEAGSRWRALRTVSTIFKVIAWVILGLGGLAVLIASISIGASDDGGAGEALLTLIFGGIGVALYALFTFAMAELIMLAIAVEENTKRTSGLSLRSERA